MPRASADFVHQPVGVLTSHATLVPKKSLAESLSARGLSTAYSVAVKRHHWIEAVRGCELRQLQIGDARSHERKHKQNRTFSFLALLQVLNLVHGMAKGEHFLPGMGLAGSQPFLWFGTLCRDSSFKVEAIVLSTRGVTCGRSTPTSIFRFFGPNDSNFTLMVPQAYVSWQHTPMEGWYVEKRWRTTRTADFCFADWKKRSSHSRWEVSSSNICKFRICFLQSATTVHEVWERQTQAIHRKGQWETIQGLNTDLCELASMRSVNQCALFHAYF